MRRTSIAAQTIMGCVVLVGAGCTTDIIDPPDPPSPRGWIYTTDAVGQADKVVVIDVASGTFDTIVVPFADLPHATVSPDGQWLAFDESGKVIVYRMASGLIRDITNSFADRRVTWHPDGQRVLAHRSPFGGVRPQLVLVNIDRSGERILFSVPAGEFIGSSSAWSPDGTQLFFTTHLDVESTLLRLDIATPALPPEAVGPPNVRDLAIARSGQIAVSYHRLEPDSMVLGLLDPQTESFTKLRDYWLTLNLAWSPDGRFLAVLYGQKEVQQTALDIIHIPTRTVVSTIHPVTKGSDVPLTWVANLPRN